MPSVDSHFTSLDWAVLIGYLLLTTWIGHRLRGSQSTIRDFFLAGRSLPWPAVCGSIIATEISALTFIGVPGMVFAANGDFRYLQWAIGSIAARFIVGLWFVRVFYEREIYSPYDYIGHQLGPRARVLTTVMFALGSVLGQSVRVLVTALILRTVTPLDMQTSILVITAFAVAWTLMGGMTTVIWTDVIQFGMFLLSAVVAAIWLISSFDQGWADYVRIAGEAGKFRVLDLSWRLDAEYTLWVALLAMPFQNLAAFGTDQLNAQRMFCCRSQADAAKAIIASSLGQIITLVMLGIGAALFAFYQVNPPAGAVAALFAADRDLVFPVWITTVLPPGLTGLVLAGAFAAAISSLDSALAALSQTTLALWHGPGQPGQQSGEDDPEQARRLMSYSRGLVVFWGCALTIVALALNIIKQQGQIDLIRLAFGMVAYTYGPMLGIFLVALLRIRSTFEGLLAGVVISLLITGFVRQDYALILQNFGWFTPGLTAALKPPVSFVWMYPLTCLLTIACGWLGYQAHPARRPRPARRVLRFLLSPPFAICLIVLGALALRYWYVFHMSQWSSYMFSDLKMYWENANLRFNGELFSARQWIGWPLGYYGLLTELFKWLKYFGQFDHRLFYSLLLNVVLSAASVFWLYRITYKLTGRYSAALIVGFFYAVCWPMIYYCCFISAENISIPFTILSIYLLTNYRHSHALIYLAGIALGIGVGARPAIGLLGLPFFLYVVFAQKLSAKRVLFGVMFTLGYFTWVGNLMVQNYYISGGKVRSVSANSGLQLYFATTHAYQVTQRFDGWFFSNIPPGTIHEPENGHFETDQPAYNNAYWYGLGKMAITRHPEVLWENLFGVWQLFWGSIFPITGAPGFSGLTDFHRYVFFVMTIFCLLFPILFKEPGIDRRLLRFLVACVPFQLVTMWLFTWEHRYLFSFLFIFYPITIALIYALLFNFRRHARGVGIYLACLAVWWVLLDLRAFAKVRFRDRHVRAEIVQNAVPIQSLDQPREPVGGTNVVYLDQVAFDRGTFLKHRTVGALGFTNNFFTSGEAYLDVEEGGQYEFAVWSDDGFRIWIDEHMLLEHVTDKSLDERRVTHILGKGRHHFRFQHYQGLHGVALFVTYRDMSDPLQIRYKIGENGPKLKFVEFQSDGTVPAPVEPELEAE